MIRPKPFSFVCANCGYKEKHHPKSDALSIDDISRICPKCNTSMEIQPLSTKSSMADNLISKICNIFAK